MLAEAEAAGGAGGSDGRAEHSSLQNLSLPRRASQHPHNISSLLVPRDAGGPRAEAEEPFLRVRTFLRVNSAAPRRAPPAAMAFFGRVVNYLLNEVRRDAQRRARRRASASAAASPAAHPPLTAHPPRRAGPRQRARQQPRLPALCDPLQRALRRGGQEGGGPQGDARRGARGKDGDGRRLLRRLSRGDEEGARRRRGQAAAGAAMSRAGLLCAGAPPRAGAPFFARRPRAGARLSPLC